MKKNRKNKSMSKSFVTVMMATAFAFSVACEGRARADDTTTSTSSSSSSPSLWREHFDEARRDLVEGRFLRAEIAFRTLAVDAPSNAERVLADEMAHLALQYERLKAQSNSSSAQVDEDGGGQAAAQRPEVRDTDELTLLYATGALYGAGTGAWFLLQTEPNSTVTAALPFAALTAAPIIAIATVDGYSRLPRGLPHSISAGAFLGLQEGIWIVGYQREHSIDRGRPWRPETNATVLWSTATAGAVFGGVLGSTLVTTPGRVSFTTSLTMWSGALFALGTGAVLPSDLRTRSENAFLAGGIGTNAGLAAGLLFSGRVSPSVARVRIVDLLGVGGAVASGGTYLAFAGKLDTRLGEGVAAIGAAAGLTVGWLVTAGMQPQRPRSSSSTTAIGSIEPSLRIVPGGGTLGVGGAF